MSDVVEYAVLRVSTCTSLVGFARMIWEKTHLAASVHIAETCVKGVLPS